MSLGDLLLKALLDHRRAVHVLLAILAISAVKAWGPAEVSWRINAAIDNSIVLNNIRAKARQGVKQTQTLIDVVVTGVETELQALALKTTDGAKVAETMLSDRQPPGWLRRAYMRVTSWVGHDAARIPGGRPTDQKSAD
jgi:hypothetical protein